MRVLRFLVLVWLFTSLPAWAFDSTTSPTPNASNVDRLTIQGEGSTGDVSGMSITPGASVLPRTLKDRAGDQVHLEDYCTHLSRSGANVTSCLQAAIDAAALTGRCLLMPVTPPSATVWTISATINIGNGDLGVASTVPGVGIQGAGSGGIYGSRGTYLTWTGPAGGTMFSINGPIENVKLRGFNMNGSNSAARLIKAGAVRFSEFHDIYGQAFTGQGFGFYGLGATGSLNVMLDIGKLYVTTNQPGATAVDFDGVLNASTDTWLSSFRNSRLESLGQNGTALRLAFSDNILFSQVHAIVDKASGCAVKFDAMTSGSGGNSFPTGHLFVKSALDNTWVVEDATHTIGVNNFIDFGTTDHEVIPTHPKLKGTTDQGFSFNGYGGPGAWAAFNPVVSSVTGAISALGTPVVRYVVNGKSVDLRATIPIAMNGSGATAVSVTLPLQPRTAGNSACHGRNVASGKMLQGVVTGGTNAVLLWNFDGAYPGQDNTSLIFSCTYEMQ